MIMEHQIVKRGYVSTDAKDFHAKSIPTLKKAAEEVYWMLNRGYPIKSLSTFIGNHYLLSERQRLALARSVSSQTALLSRKKREIQGTLSGKTVFIDGFNQIITLEVALSDGTLLHCMDGTIRDLAGLRGTYRLIDKTTQAIKMIGAQLQQLQISQAVFYLDSPVSNSGRLKQEILTILQHYPFTTQVHLTDNADVVLETLPNVITSDAIILDHCESWVNLNYPLIQQQLPSVTCLQITPDIGIFSFDSAHTDEK